MAWTSRTLVIAGLLAGPSVAEAQVVLCHDTGRDLVTRSTAAECKGQVVTEKEADDIRRRRAERIRGAVKPPVSPFPALKLAGMGTGFFVDPSGLLLTNHHVIAECTGLSFDPAMGEETVATLEASEPQLDLAALRIPRSSVAAARFGADTRLRAGDPLVVVGYPNRGISRVQPIATGGEFGAFGAPVGGIPRFAMQGEVRRGNSGGPVLDSSGLVIGVVFAKRNTVEASKAIGGPVEDFGFAIPARDAIAWLKRLGHEVAFGFPASEPMPQERIFAQAQSFVGRVNCWR